MLSGKRLPKKSVGPNFASRLLKNEPQGFAVDATVENGRVSVKDSTLANNLYNVLLDNSNLVQSGTSPKMVPWGSSPYLRWTPHNYVLQSQTLDNAAWTSFHTTVTANDTSAPDGTTTAEKFVETNTDSSISNTSALTILPGVPYTFSVYGKRSNVQWLGMYITDDSAFTNSARQTFDLLNGALGTTTSNLTGTHISVSSPAITSAANGFYRCSVTFINTTDTTCFLWFIMSSSDGGSPANGDTFWLWGAQLCRGYNANPYLVTTSAARIGIPQAYDTDAAQYGILVEPAATNLLLRSEDFGTTWTATRTSVSTNAVTAPDGATTADTFTADGTNNTHFVQQTGLTISGNSYSLSVFAKAGTNSLFQMFFGGGSDDFYGNFDLTNGTCSGGTTSSASPTVSITSIGNGWYRCVMSVPSVAGNSIAVGFLSITSLSDARAASNTNSGTTHFWGAQLETGSVATSYIPTLGSAVTRAADVIKAANTTFPWSDTNGSIYAKYNPLNVDSGSRYVWQSYKDANNHISLVDVTADPELENTQASTQDVLLDAGTLVANTLTRVSGAYKGNDFDVSQDGGAVQSDGASTLTTGYTDLYIGTKGSATTEELNGYIYQLLYVPYQRQTVSGDIDTWKNTA